jgi:DNA invertase Pin-like site-specific DNA recombinase
MINQKDCKVGIYARLSKEDARRGSGTQALYESTSIENQKLLLTKHVKEMGWELREVYQDDGFSGTNQNRPAFRRMLADIESGYINTILIKDLSRLGRNYLEVGNLAEVFLPEHGCELISLGEKIDDMMVFRNWFNEQHSKSTSIKVRAVKKICAENGKYMGAYAPYGYMKALENRHKLVPDPNTAPIVRRIFEMRASGAGFRAVAQRLSADGVLPPREYYYRSREREPPCRNGGKWSENTIKDIIKNEVYLGDLVQGKTGSASYKNPKQVGKPRGEWICVQGTHEPLVERELWARANALSGRKHKPRRKNDGEVNLFSGLLYCGDCGFKLRGQTERRTRRDGSVAVRVSYMCGTYAHCGRDACTIHGISESALLTVMSGHINAGSAAVTTPEPYYMAAYQSELEMHGKAVAKIDIIIENLYSDKISGLIPASLFKRQVFRYEQDRADREQAAERLKQRIESLNTSESTETPPQKRTVTREALFRLVAGIIVGETKVINGKRVCEVRVYFNSPPSLTPGLHRVVSEQGL